jgi:hypothetical protein
MLIRRPGGKDVTTIIIHYVNRIGLLLTAYCLLLTAYCLLLTAYCLLLTAYCLLLTAYCLLLTSFPITSVERQQ